MKATLAFSKSAMLSALVVSKFFCALASCSAKAPAQVHTTLHNHVPFDMLAH